MLGVRVLPALPIRPRPGVHPAAQPSPLPALSYPGISAAALAAVEAPNPLDLPLLRDALKPLADPVDGPLNAVLAYGKLLLAANSVVNLTGARSWDQLIPAHLVDCLTAARFLPDDARTVVDWGSGGGLPGLVWASVFPEKRLLLCERRGKRAAFLEDAAQRLELFHVEVLAGQAEELIREEGHIDVIVVRAVEALPRLLTRLQRNRVYCEALFLLAGPRWQEDWDALSDEQRSRWIVAARNPYELPAGHGARQVVVLKRR